MSSAASAASDRTWFDDPAFGIIFEYPKEMVRGEYTAGVSTGSEPIASAALAFTRRNCIALDRYALARPVGPAEMPRTKAVLDETINRLDSDAKTGWPARFGGLVGYEYQVSNAETRSRYVALFDDDAQYMIYAQATPELLDQVAAAFSVVLATLAPRPVGRDDSATPGESPA